MKQNYDIRINPPELSGEAIEKHKNFDALLNQFQQSQQQYEVQTNPPQLSSEAIGKHKNFAALLQQFQQTAAEEPTPTPKVAFVNNKTWVKYGLGALLAVAASIMVVFIVGKTFNSPNEAYQEEVLALQQPLPKIIKNFFQYSVEADKGDTLRHNSGSRIIVPASAFVDKNGKPVTGKVDIEYREFNDHVDMFLAGVPKELDKHQNLQSVGMMQIQGYQEGKPVFIDKEKTLEVELEIEIPAEIPTDDVKVYAFNGNENTWQAKGTDQIEVLSSPINTTVTTNNTPQTNTQEGDKEYQKALQTALASIEAKYPEPIKPLSPTVHDPNRHALALDFEESRFPELKNYRDIGWEILPGQEFKKEWSLEDGKREWDELVIERRDYGFYELHFWDDKDDVRLRVTPVFKNEKDRKAMEQYYKTELAKYEAGMNDRNQRVAADLAQWKAKNQPATHYAQTNTDTLAKDIAVKTKKIINRFKIDKFGLWNCGNPAPLRDEMNIHASFVNADGKPISVKQIFLSNNRQRLYYFANPQNNASTDIKYDAAAQPVLWAMTEDNQLMVANEAPTPEGDKMQFHLRPAPPANTENDVRQALAYYN